MSDRQDMQLSLLQRDLLELERSRGETPAEARPEIALAIAKRIDDYLDIIEAELRSMVVMSAELALPSHAPRPENVRMSEYHRETARAAMKGTIAWYDEQRPSFWSYMVESHGLDFPMPVELLRILNEKIANHRHAAEESGKSITGLVFNAETMGVEGQPYTIDDETSINLRFLWWHMSALSKLMDQWALQIYDGKLPGPDSQAYWKALSFFAYELTPQHAHLMSMASGKKSSKRISANQLEPIDGSPVGRGIPWEPEAIAALYAQALAAAAREFTVGAVRKPAWSFEFLNLPRTFRQGAYRIGKGRRKDDTTLYRIAPMERSVFTAVRYITHGLRVDAPLTSANGIQFAKSLVSMLSPRWQPTHLWTMALAVCYDFLLPHNEVRLQFATELVDLLYQPDQPPQATLTRLGELLPTADTMMASIYAGGPLKPQDAFHRFQALSIERGVDESQIWAVRDSHGNIIVHDGKIVLASVDAVAYNNDRQMRNLQQTISNCLETSLLIKWIKHISKLWAQTADELGIPRTALTAPGGLSRRDLDRMLVGMGLENALFRDRYASPATAAEREEFGFRRIVEGDKQRWETWEEYFAREDPAAYQARMKFAPNKAWHHPMPYHVRARKGSTEKPKTMYIRLSLRMAHGRVNIDPMQICLILNKHELGDVSGMPDGELARRVMTPATVNIIKTFMDYGARDVVANFNWSIIQDKRDQAQKEIDDYRAFVSADNTLTEEQRIDMLTTFMGELDKKYGITELIAQADQDTISLENVDDMEKAAPEPPRPEPEPYYRMAREIFNDILSRAYQNGKFSFNLAQQMLKDYLETPTEVLRERHQAPSRTAGYIFKKQDGQFTRRTYMELDFKQIVRDLWLEFLDAEIRAKETPVAPSESDRFTESMKDEDFDYDRLAGELRIRHEDTTAAEYRQWLWQQAEQHEDEEIRVKKTPPPQSDPALFAPQPPKETDTRPYHYEFRSGSMTKVYDT